MGVERFKKKQPDNGSQETNTSVSIPASYTLAYLPFAHTLTLSAQSEVPAATQESNVTYMVQLFSGLRLGTVTLNYVIWYILRYQGEVKHHCTPYLL